MTQARDEQELPDEIVRRIVAVADPDKIILFGSRARGEADEESDYDVLVVAPSSEDPWRRAVPIHRALRGVPASCDIVWRTPEEVDRWRGVPSHLLTRATREGLTVYERAA